MSKGLVLEGGGLRGIFTAGVLDYFMEQDLWFDTLIGVSAGACHGCSYKAQQPGRALRISVDYLDDPRYCSVRSLLTTGDMFGVDFCYRAIPDLLDPMDYAQFNKNPMRFFATVTNLETGKAVYHQVANGYQDVTWVRASASLPLVSRKVEIDGKYYLDGGIADSIPYLKSIHLGNDKNVVVLTRPKGYRKEPSSLQPLIAAEYRKYPKFVQASASRYLGYNQTLERLEQDEAAGKVFVIRPPETLNIGRTEKNKEKLTEGYHIGYQVTKEIFPALMEYLNN